MIDVIMYMNIFLNVKKGAYYVFKQFVWIAQIIIIYVRFKIVINNIYDNVPKQINKYFLQIKCKYQLIIHYSMQKQRLSDNNF